jgi:aspartyl-tRNA(Asn)/glutamyl-tRNA(Gln) amidotransferase subunit C
MKNRARYNPFMSLSVKDARHIAELAHIRVSDEELEHYRTQLESILEYAERLRLVDTSQILPTTTVLPMSSVLREDEIRPSLDQELVLANAPQSDREMFQIPAVFEK